MNTSNIKSYAPKARKNFIAAMTKQAAKYGITASAIEPIQQKGDLALIGDRPFPAAIIKPRAALVQKIKQLGFTQVIEQVAYSWFNRLCAIRYMELKDYLEHGRRVLSSPNQTGSFQILDDCLDIDLAGLDQTKVRALKLDGTQDEQLYRELLLAQCHALHKAMPFLFEAVDDETELLLPENLTKTDSLIHELVNEIPEEDWHSVEIIGWLYQFYISEKKDEVIGKVVKSEDIPAATQLFTPNWIVKYMVQNSLGAQWLATYPESPLKAHMEYYITPAVQTDEVNAQLKAITPSALNPEELTLIDPACGSGHILVEAYDLFKAIYLERGYRQRDVAQLILEKNLFGLDIDQRAAQLTGFALMMKGRDDDRRLFERDIKLNVMAMVDSTGFDVDALVGGINLAHYGLEANDLIELKNLFENATTFGSLIQVPSTLIEKLPALKQLSELNAGDLFTKESLENLQVLVKQAELLAQQYDSVVANPPYIGSKYHTPLLKKYLKDNYNGYEKDVFSAFIDRDFQFAKNNAQLAFMSPFVWMFISSHEHLRTRLIEKETITTLIQLEYSGFDGATVPICTFTLRKGHLTGEKGCFIRLSDFKGSENQAPKTLEAINNRSCGWFFEAAQDEFKKIPGSPVAYWLPGSALTAFANSQEIKKIVPAAVGLQTGDNEKFVRRWHEVAFEHIGFGIDSCESSVLTGRKWFPYNKGGEYRKWFGNRDFVVDWLNDGEKVRNFFDVTGKLRSRPQNTNCYFKPSISWSDVTSGQTSFRYFEKGFIYDVTGMSAQSESIDDLKKALAFCNSKIVSWVVKSINPTLHFQIGNYHSLPFIKNILESVNVANVDRCIDIAIKDDSFFETSFSFKENPIKNFTSLPHGMASWRNECKPLIDELMEIETENNAYFINGYALDGELNASVDIENLSLNVNPAYRYGGNLTEDEQQTRFREDTMKELVSYSIGCMMGRYSLDEPGIIYAHSGNEDFDANRYQTFKADDDGIIPLTDKEWFSDDAANRLEEFISVAWDAAHLEENLAFLADNLSPKKGESSRETLRRYLCDSFYKDHTQTYKKRPIYWLFTSGKQKAFQCLVYLHRYNEGTLARMRTQYVIPLTAKLAAHVNKLEQDKDASTSTPEIKKLEKEIATLHKQQAELSTFDEKLRHCADQRITLDLDDGVKVNYGKFGDLLADVKAIAGTSGDGE